MAHHGKFAAIRRAPRSDIDGDGQHGRGWADASSNAGLAVLIHRAHGTHGAAEFKRVDLAGDDLMHVDAGGGHFGSPDVHHGMTKADKALSVGPGQGAHGGGAAVAAYQLHAQSRSGAQGNVHCVGYTAAHARDGVHPKRR